MASIRRSGGKRSYPAHSVIEEQVAVRSGDDIPAHMVPPQAGRDPVAMQVAIGCFHIRN
jgi:hypothetical protein